MGRQVVPRLRVRGRADFFARVVAAKRPVILEGVIDRWPLRAPPGNPDKTLARLRQLAGHRNVLVSWAHGRHGGLLSYGTEGEGGTRNWTYVPRRFTSFLDDLQADAGRRTGHVLYMAAANVTKDLPELRPLMRMPLLDKRQAAQHGPLLWMGNGRHRVALHYDGADNLNCMIMGRKRFTLLPPSAIPYVYLGGLEAGPAGAPTAMVDPLKPDFERYPRFREVQAQMLVAEVRAGDVLFIPAFWLHHVESFDLNAAVNYWWSDVPGTHTAAADAALAHGLLSVRSLPPYERSLYKILFDFLVFHQHGNPFAHLPVGKQGWAGAPTPARVAELQERVARFTKTLEDGRRGSQFSAESRYVVARGASYRFAESGNIEVRDAQGNAFAMPDQVLDILRDFRKPVAPIRAAKQRFPRSRAGRDELVRTCAALVGRGLLIPHAGAEAADSQPDGRASER